MKKIIVLQIKNLDQYPQAQALFETFLTSLHLESQLKEITPKTHLQYRIPMESQDIQKCLDEKITELSDKYSIKAKWRITSLEALVELEQGKKVSQQTKTFPQQFSNNSCEIIEIIQFSRMQAQNISQTKSDSSGEFQVLDEVIEEELKQRTNEQPFLQVSKSIQEQKQRKQSFQKLEMRSQDQIAAYASANDEQIKVCSVQKDDKITKNEQKVNQTQQNNPKNYQQAQDQTESQQFDLTNQKLAKYFMGKDDYTQVFNLSQQLDQPIQLENVNNIQADQINKIKKSQQHSGVQSIVDMIPIKNQNLKENSFPVVEEVKDSQKNIQIAKQNIKSTLIKPQWIEVQLVTNQEAIETQQNQIIESIQQVTQLYQQQVYKKTSQKESGELIFQPHNIAQLTQVQNTIKEDKNKQIFNNANPTRQIHSQFIDKHSSQLNSAYNMTAEVQKPFFGKSQYIILAVIIALIVVILAL